MNAQAYLDLRKRHEKELSDFPIAYAFNDEQLKEALVKLGVVSTRECVTVFGHGDIVKKENAPKLIEMFKRHNEELREAMLADEEFAAAAFLYEMDNHEYSINLDGDDDVLNCFALSYEDLEKLNLLNAYNRARRAHYKHAQEWGMI